MDASSYGLPWAGLRFLVEEKRPVSNHGLVDTLLPRGLGINFLSHCRSLKEHRLFEGLVWFPLQIYAGIVLWEPRSHTYRERSLLQF